MKEKSLSNTAMRKITDKIHNCRKVGMGWGRIADELNDLGFKTAR